MILVSIDTTDYAGHGFAFSAYEPKYVQAVEKVDAQIERILGAIEKRPSR